MICHNVLLFVLLNRSAKDRWRERQGVQRCLHLCSERLAPGSVDCLTSGSAQHVCLIVSRHENGTGESKRFDFPNLSEEGPCAHSGWDS